MARQKHLVITGASAMQAWDEGIGAFACPTRISAPAGFAASGAELAAFSMLPQGCTEPVEVLVGDIAKRARSRRWHASHRSAPMPAGSLWEIGGNRCVVSPAFFFASAAPRLSLVQAVLLGMELCGLYSTLMSPPYRALCDEARVQQGGVLREVPWPPSEWGMSFEHQRDLVDNGFIVREPLLSVQELRGYLIHALSEKSHSRAIVAARLVKDGSRSPMESRLYARYCLPRRYGGLNLNPVELNREFELSPDVARAIGISRYSVDLFWPDGAVGIEYQGRFAHTGLSAEQRDRLKRNILETAGVRIISIDRNQYANEDILELYAQEIAKSMGIEKWRLRPKAGESIRRAQLADELRDWEVDLYRPPVRGR